MLGLALDPVTGDLADPVALETDRVTLISTRIRARLEMIQGDWFLDATAGTAWLRILGEKPDLAEARRVATESILLDPDVVECQVSVDIDRALRLLTIEARARLTDGTTVEVAATAGA